MNLTEKQALYSEFFTIPLSLNLNLVAFLPDEPIPDENGFIEEMPFPFKLATQVNSLEAESLRSIRHLGKQADELVNFLNLQSKKLDLIMSYILMQEDDTSARFQSLDFGAGGLTVKSQTKWGLEQVFRLKIFIPDESSAVYCYAEIIDVSETEQGYLYKLVYRRIREEDREILVRTALHQQSKQLRQLAQQKAQQSSE
ncbi:PilZ domain-containing protein [Catenovulum sp. 2E275]|uniref:PilZ domain-containing protein n=1 Tax=Catenovulum sp. 2E275 TaxID=2980497 RepID=UPI0021CFE268|nr:PilZ domain-containing protein [Catenovulum sp. 2E275]MCU4674920.1 PilZ domain-containing protein [Catenovulum sp. 2E275]